MADAEAKLAEGKAQGFNSTVVALRELCSPEQFGQIVSALSPETRALVERPALPLEWLPDRHFTELIATAERLILRGDEAAFEKLGAESLKRDISTVYRVFIRIASPQYVISRAAQIWSTYARNGGTLTATPIGDRSVDVRYEGVP